MTILSDGPPTIDPTPASFGLVLGTEAQLPSRALLGGVVTRDARMSTTRPPHGHRGGS